MQTWSIPKLLELSSMNVKSGGVNVTLETLRYCSSCSVKTQYNSQYTGSFSTVDVIQGCS